MANRSAILAIKIIADAENARKGLDSAATSAQKFERGLNKASILAAAALAGIGAAAIKAAGKASDLGESVNAVGKVFGPATDQILAFGKTAAESVGLSNTAFNEMATKTGSILQGYGQSTSQAADSTIALSQRAADMASVFNTDVSTAMEAINSGLNGQSEPLRAFGVNLTDAALKSQALTMGLWDGKGALDANAKAAAAQALIMETTANTAGDFAETSDGLANSQRILTAKWDDAQAALGGVLLPYMETAVAVFTDLITWVEANAATVQKLVGAVAGLSAVVLVLNGAMKAYRAITVAVKSAQLAWKAATIVMTYAQWALNVAMASNPIGLVVIAIVALIAGLILAYKKSDTFRAMVNKLAAVLKGAFLGAIRAVQSAFKGMANALSSAWSWLGAVIGRVGELLSRLNPLKSIGGIFGGIFRSATAPAVVYTPAPTLPPSGPGPRRPPETGGAPTFTVNGAVNPHEIAMAIARVMTGAKVRTGYAGVRV